MKRFNVSPFFWHSASRVQVIYTCHSDVIIKFLVFYLRLGFKPHHTKQDPATLEKSLLLQRFPVASTKSTNVNWDEDQYLWCCSLSLGRRDGEHVCDQYHWAYHPINPPRNRTIMPPVWTLFKRFVIARPASKANHRMLDDESRWRKPKKYLTIWAARLLTRRALMHPSSTEKKWVTI